MSPNDPDVVSSEFVESVLTLLEAGGTPTEINDSIVAILEWWEAGSHQIDYSNPKTGFLLVGHNPETGEVVVNLDHDRTGHIVFSPAQARHLAGLLNSKAAELDGLPA